MTSFITNVSWLDRRDSFSVCNKRKTRNKILVTVIERDDVDIYQDVSIDNGTI